MPSANLPKLLLLLLLPSPMLAHLDGAPISSPNGSLYSGGSPKNLANACGRPWNGEEPMHNQDRMCPVVYRHQEVADRSPRVRAAAECQCRQQRATMTAGFPECVSIRLPVTEFSVSAIGGRSRLVERTVLTPVDCATLQPRRHRPAPVVTTGAQMLELERQIGGRLFEPVNCDHGSGPGPRQQEARAVYELRLDPETVPRMWAAASCPCVGQAPASLPLPVLRQVGGSDDGHFRMDLLPVPVGCTVLLQDGR